MIATTEPTTQAQAPARAKRQKAAVLPLRLVERPAPNASAHADAVKFFLDMAAMAGRGEVIGWTGAYITSDRKFTTHTVGELRDNPVYAIGLLDLLVAKLRRKVLG